MLCCTLHLTLKSGKRANISTARDTTTNPWKAEGSRDARHTAANIAAFSDTELDTLRNQNIDNIPRSDG